MKRAVLLVTGLLLASCALGAQPDLPSIGGGNNGTGSAGIDLPGDSGSEGLGGSCGTAGAGGLGGAGEEASAGSCAK